MLCQRCKKREATVHLTLIEGTSDSPQQDFCESCYPDVEDERIKSFNALIKPLPPLTINIEQITAAEFLAETHHIKEISEKLAHLPKTRERLAFELLTMALDSLKRGEFPHYILGMAGCFAGFIPQERRPEYAVLLEEIILRISELIKSQNPSATRHFLSALGLAAATLHLTDKDRFTSDLANLKRQYEKDPTDALRKIIEEIDESISRLAKATQRKRK
jgi:hypothetical protein